METVLILDLPHLMPTRRVQYWVRAQGMGKVRRSERVRTSWELPTDKPTMGRCCRELSDWLKAKGAGSKEKMSLTEGGLER